MGKQFVTRTRGEWETLTEQDVEETRGLGARASVWLQWMLQRFDQAAPETPITLAVPDRFWKALEYGPEINPPMHTSPQLGDDAQR